MTPMTEPVKGDVPPSVYLGRQYLKEMLVKKCVRVLFQPIVSLDSEGTAGYEALARGTHSALSIKPVELFNLAQRCDMASSLSAMFRQAAIKDAAQLPGSGYLFLNIHPSEMHGDELLLSLRDLQATAPTNWQLVLEINEHAVADLPVWRRLRQQVKELGLLLAYDDFGAGQARILELADLPPDFVKLDMALIRNIHLVPSRQKVVQALAQASRKMGVQVIAEGIECDGEARTCRELGCHLGQGFLFAAPQGLGAIRAPFATSP
jgi:EAL domain-containing protein (putative c-di-GMP-specific phosphodiesterase class I)